MQQNCVRVEISAENESQANSILDALLKKKLITGGQIINAPARFLWKGEIIDTDYCTISSFTIEAKKAEIISEVKKVSVEEVPMISFMNIDGNEELLQWITQTVSK